jgi:hypothetical protein
MTIFVSNNPDGTFTVRCGADEAVVGTPKDPGTVFPPVSSAGGGVTAQIFDTSKPVPGAQPMASFHELLASLQTFLPEYSTAGPSTDGKPWVLAYALRGAHEVDVSKLNELTRSFAREGAVQCHIYFDNGND